MNIRTLTIKLTSNARFNSKSKKKLLTYRNKLNKRLQESQRPFNELIKIQNFHHLPSTLTVISAASTPASFSAVTVYAPECLAPHPRMRNVEHSCVFSIVTSLPVLRAFPFNCHVGLGSGVPVMTACSIRVVPALRPMGLRNLSSRVTFGATAREGDVERFSFIFYINM